MSEGRRYLLAEATDTRTLHRLPAGPENFHHLLIELAEGHWQHHQILTFSTCKLYSPCEWSPITE